MEVSSSFASLVKSNNGFFKSDKQAEFLLNQCSENVYCSQAITKFRSWYSMIYFCDAKGVTKVEKNTSTGLTVVWERAAEGQVSMQDAKEIKRLQRLIKQDQKSIESRTKSMEAGSYDGAMSLYNYSMERDIKSIQTLEAMLAKIQ